MADRTILPPPTRFRPTAKPVAETILQPKAGAAVPPPPTRFAAAALAKQGTALQSKARGAVAPPPSRYDARQPAQGALSLQAKPAGAVAPPATRFGQPRAALQPKSAGGIAPPPVRFAAKPSTSPRPAQPARCPGGCPPSGSSGIVMARYAPFGLVLQAKWVFIGDALKRVNMSTSEKIGVDYEWDGKDYEEIGSRDDSPVVREISNDIDIEEDENSLYSQHSLNDSEDEFENTFNGRSDMVLKQYRDFKHFNFSNQINSSEGLKDVVFQFETGGQPAANTHVLYRNTTEEDSKYSFVQLNTANAVSLYLLRYNFQRTGIVRNNFKKLGNVHTEMALLHELTGGKANAIANVLNGYKLVVDKPVCADCYPYVKLAAPDMVDDSTSFYEEGAKTRESWNTWTNPFK